MALHPFLVALVEKRPAWQRDALCVEHPELTWFPARGQSTGPAKAVCARCLVRAECLEYGLELDEPAKEEGVWGGLSPQERRRLRARAA